MTNKFEYNTWDQGWNHGFYSDRDPPTWLVAEDSNYLRGLAMGRAFRAECERGASTSQVRVNSVTTDIAAQAPGDDGADQPRR
jgi:hypothetical protein